MAALLVAAGLGAGVSSGSQHTTEADLSVSKSDNPDPVAVNTPLTYTIQVKNNGPAPATGVRLTDKLPNNFVGVTPTTTAGTCQVVGQTVTCNLGTIGVGTGATIPTVTITGTPTKTGRFTNSASVDSNTRDPRASNNLATERTRVIQPRTVTCEGEAATLVGTPGADRLIGTRERDVVFARGGADVIKTFRGEDIVCAGGGPDKVITGIWADTVFGNGGTDRLVGGGGADELFGNRGDDRLLGRRGDDRLIGGSGFDVCRPGRGFDVERSCER